MVRSSSESENGVGDADGVLDAPALGPFGFRFSRVSPLTFSAAHTDLEYSENHARDVSYPGKFEETNGSKS